MNERIKQLAKQAGFDVELMERNHANGNPSMAHEFAELIIEECHEVIVVGGVDDLDGLKKHFEVE
jgi:hypothetical protein